MATEHPNTPGTAVSDAAGRLGIIVSGEYGSGAKQGRVEVIWQGESFPRTPLPQDLTAITLAEVN